MEQYYYVTDNSVVFRYGCRDGAYVVDKTLTALGFIGIENVDWMNLKELTLT